MTTNNKNLEILQLILTELEIAKQSRKEILTKLEYLEEKISELNFLLKPENKVNIITTKTEKIESVFNINYQPLEEILKNKQWLEADRETARIVLQLSDREKQGYLNESDLHKLPDTELIKLDRLWLNYSNNRFGFSVQNKLYQSLGGRKFFEPEIWRKFGESVGWFYNKKWLNYEELNFNENAPIGHLPVMGDGQIWFVGGWEGSFNAFSILLVKLVQYKII